MGYPADANPFAWPGNYVQFGSYRLWDTTDVSWSYIQRVGPQQIERVHRTHGVVTVTTVDDHGMLPRASAITVAINGVTDPSFDGSFKVSAVLGPRSFTFSQDQPNAYSEGGTELASDWTVLDGAVAKARDKQTLYTFGAVPLWATKSTPAKIPVDYTNHLGTTFTVTTRGPHPFHFNSGDAQWVKLKDTPDHFLDGIYLLQGVPNDQQLTFQGPSSLPSGIRGGEVQIFDRGGGADFHLVPGTRIPYSPSAGMEPDPELFRNFVDTVISRYCGCTRESLPGMRIDGYETWNEPNITAEHGSGASFFVPDHGRSVQDSAAAMVPLAQIVWTEVRRIDPKAIVVSPSATGDLTGNGVAWLNAFLQDGGGRYFDVLGYHLYVSKQPPEAMLPVIQEVRRTLQAHNLSTPIWNTEVGWGGNQVIPAGAAAGYVARTYLLNWAAGVQRVYWYQWNNQCWVKLRMTSGPLPAPQCNDSRQPTGITPAATAYQEVSQWMVGSSLKRCASQDDVWICQIRLHDGKSGHIVWRTTGSSLFDIPKEWNSHQLTDLTGARQSVATQVPIGSSPILLD
ncbi:MAG: glycosyl hydrolase [Acidobacteriaceae bacterium]